MLPIAAVVSRSHVWFGFKYFIWPCTRHFYWFKQKYVTWRHKFNSK